MWIQSSFKEKFPTGMLYIVPTPIGNLEDMTYRAVHTLQTVDWIAAEDTRNTKKLCNHFSIETPLFSYHDHNKKVSGQKIIALLEEGKHIAIVSDAGTPCVSDPGYEIVAEAIAKQIPVIALPGASAGVTALSASGLDTNHFYFYGFLDRVKKKKKEILADLKNMPDTIVFYESPHRLKETLAAMLEVLGNRNLVVMREMTKVYEQIFRGKMEEVLAYFEDNDPRGEFCILIEGNRLGTYEQPQNIWEDWSVEEHIEYYMEEENLSSKDAIKRVAQERKMPKREVYQAYHIEENK